MRKVFLSALVCLFSTAAISCGSKASDKAANSNGSAVSSEDFYTPETAEAGLSTTNSHKIDTLSYIVGMDMGNSIEMNMLPMFKIDYDVMFSTIERALNPKATIKVEGVSFNKDNFREIGDKYINEDFRDRVMKVMDDSTATIYNSEQEKKIVSAILGADIAYSAMQVKFPLDNSSLLAAIKDIHNGEAKLTNEFAMEYTRNYFTVVVPEQNKKDSEKWLAKIEKQKNIQKTESGILYRIEKDGDSNVKATKDEDVVKVLYTGRTKDGKVFDSNRWNDMPKERQEMIKMYQPDQASKDNPIEFPLNRVIKGWTEGMKLIGKGGRIVLWIPAELAYGEQGAGNDIGPNEALCFDVELLEVTNK